MTLLALDRHWSSHLAQMRWNRDRLALIGLIGKNPLAEFFREAGDEFDRLPSRVEDQAVKDLRADRGHGRRRRLGAGRAPRPLVDLDLSGERSVPRQQRAAGPLAPPRRRGVGRDHAWSTRLPVEGGVSAGYGAGNARRATRHSRGGALETWPRATAQRWRRSRAFTMLPRGAGSCGLERAICPHSADTAAIAYPAKPL